ncbi:MAG TPA: hypothetical protein VIN63_04375 [Candidatus Limnocylindria bacterium]
MRPFALVGRSVLVDKHFTGCKEHRCGKRAARPTRSHDETVAWRDDALPEEAEKPPRLNRHAESSPRPHVETVERLDVARCVANGDLDTCALCMPRVSSVRGRDTPQGDAGFAIERQDVSYCD